MADADRWQRVGDLFDAALAHPSAKREWFVRGSGEPQDIQDEVLRLLASHEADDDTFLDPTALHRDTGSGGTFAAPGPPAIDSPPPAQLAAGTALGPYRIVSVVGEGGMGTVYHAEDTRLHRAVALKLLSPNLAGEARQRERLKQEARAAAALSHPGIATVYALEEVEDQTVIASELLSGETLRTEIARGPLPLDRALATAIDIARAMAAAHERGIVHRDLKPENILRTTSGIVKILDFGLAQFDDAARDLVSIARLTQSGFVGGTPPYMAPEQLLGKPTDFRTDHFAFGVMLYEMTSGRHPFGGQSLPSTIARILAGEARPPEPHAHIPVALWRIIERCLQKDPAARYGSTTALLRELELIERESRSAPALSERPRVEGPALSERSRVQPSEARPTEREAQGLPSGAAARPVWWWQFHQLAAAVVYWAMVWPVWHVHRDIGRSGLFFFFATLAAVIVAANLRIHLWFSSRVYPHELAAQRADVGRWIRAADCAFVVLLVAGGLLLPAGREAWATLLIAVGIGTTLAFLIIEPATARAAFDRS